VQSFATSQGQLSCLREAATSCKGVIVGVAVSGRQRTLIGQSSLTSENSDKVVLVLVVLRGDGLEHELSIIVDASHSSVVIVVINELMLQEQATSPPHYHCS